MTTPTNPQPAKTPRTDKFRDTRLQMMDSWQHDFDAALEHAATLERTLAEREAEVARLKERIQAVAEAGRIEGDQLRASLRAAEERTQRAEDMLAYHKAEEEYAKERLATVADEIEKTRVASALRRAANLDTSQTASPEQCAVVAEAMFALEDLTALVANLREGKP